MRLLPSCSPLATLLLLTSGARLSQAMAAWFTDFGPQVILQNDTTGKIHYTTCNTEGQPTYSYENVLELTAYPPKMNTALTGAGYYDDVKTVASIYYLDENDVVINALFNCNMTTGLFEFEDNWVISGVAPIPLSSVSGLAVVLLGKTAGYRLYYHDENMAINEFAYKPGDQWRHKGVISQDPQGHSAIAAGFSGNENITVVTARDAENIGVTRYHADTTWRFLTFPHRLAGNLTTQDTPPENITIDQTIQPNFTLPAWNGKAREMGISIDPKYTRSVWYIGEDKQLYQIANKNWTWSHQNSQPPDIWPQADLPNSPLAVASEFTSGQLRIYYLVNNTLAELKNKGGEVGWEKWSTLPPPGPMKIMQPAPTPTPSDTPTPETQPSGLSTGAKIGLGLGVSLGILAIGLTSAACFLLRRNRKQDSAPEAGATLHDGSYKPIGSSAGSFPSPLTSSYGGGVPQPPGSQDTYNAAGYDHYAWEKKLAGGIAQADNTGIYQLDATGRPVELDSPRPVYELSDQPYTHELMGEGRHPPQTQTQTQTQTAAATSPIPSSIAVQESPIINK